MVFIIGFLKIIGFLLLSGFFGTAGQLLCSLLGMNGSNSLMIIACDLLGLLISFRIFYGRKKDRSKDNGISETEKCNDNKLEPVVETEADKQFCFRCGKEIPCGSSICLFCGTNQPKTEIEDVIEKNKPTKAKNTVARIIAVILGLALVGTGIYYSVYTKGNLNAIKAMYDEKAYRSVLEKYESANPIHFGFYYNELKSIAEDALEEYYYFGIEYTERATPFYYRYINEGMENQASILYNLPAAVECFEYIDKHCSGYRDSKEYLDIAKKLEVIDSATDDDEMSTEIISFLKKYSNETIAVNCIEINKYRMFAYLRGKWKTDDNCYSLDCKGKQNYGIIDYNLPGNLQNTSCKLYIDNAVMSCCTQQDYERVQKEVYEYSSGGFLNIFLEMNSELEKNKIELIKMSIVDENTLKAYCYSDGSTIILHRQ